MIGINRRGLLLGAFASGIVMNVLDGLTNGILFVNEFRANSIRLGLDPAAAESSLGIVTWVSLDFLFGLVLVWLYAAMRPTYGAGPLTALRAAAAVYLPTTGIILGFGVLGILTGSLLVKMSISGAIVLAAGALVGWWFYRE